MALYFFNIHDGVTTPDREGTEMSSLHEVQLEAIRLAGSLIADCAETIVPGKDWAMEVIDNAGVVCLRLTFHISGTDAVERSSPDR